MPKFELMIEPLALNVLKLKRRSSAHSALAHSSADLIARARAGEHDAFRVIFNRFAKPIASFINDLVNNRDLAEELTQETFVRAYKNLGQIRDDTKLSTWLFGIGKNVAREALRSQVRATGDENIEAAAPVTSNATSPSEALMGKELQSAIRKALRSLDDDQRLVFILKVFRQCRYDEISEITGFSIAKVKTDLHRARAELRKLVRPFLEHTQ
ncbi:MAG TPA: sigma-70 family RNA polymerase sigma factor [Pyrinomonadaceae bacterium]|nr:sigma-70 family RNA polymerase sigma factor [Pyrinomonadaceae bacterium]